MPFISIPIMWNIIHAYSFFSKFDISDKNFSLIVL